MNYGVFDFSELVQRQLLHLPMKCQYGLCRIEWSVPCWTEIRQNIMQHISTLLWFWSQYRGGSRAWLVRRDGMWCLYPQVKEQGRRVEGWQWGGGVWTQPGDVWALCGCPDRQTVPITHTHTFSSGVCGLLNKERGGKMADLKRSWQLRPGV